MSRLQDVLKMEGDNYILPFFWQHGEDENTLRKYMQVIHDANIGAVCVESRPHPDFAGDRWWTDMDVILAEAKRLGMKVWILDDSHFPTGFANGAVKKAPKEFHHKYLCYRTLEMAGPVKQVEFEVKQYMQPAPPPPWIPAPPKSEDDFADDRLVKVLACPVLEKEELGAPIDLTDKIMDGTVVFDLPDGYFKIFVIYVTRNGKGRNDYINFMDRDSCRILIDAVYETHYAHYKEYFGDVIAGFFSDEPPIGNVEGYMPIGPIGAAGQDLPWSTAAEEALKKEFGSEQWMELSPYLWAPAADKEKQAKVRNAYMEMVTKLVAACFSEQNGQWCKEHGVEYIGHMLEDCDMNMNLGASMGHFFRGLSGQHMAGVDNIGGQVTINGQNAARHDSPACKDESGFYQYTIAKLGASHAAIDPKKMGRCMCENFGAYGWQSGPKEEKFMMDHFLVRGVNRYVPHAFTPAPFPDPDCPPHFYAHGENPTYRAFGELMAYSNRVCHLIDGGIPHPDVAVLYAAESVWAGNGSSNIPVCRALGQAQVDFHVIPADVFAPESEYPMQFDGKKLMVNGVEYRALVISGCTFLEKHTAEFVMEAVSQGFLVVFTDCKPSGIVNATSKENEAFVNKMIECPLVPADETGTYLKEQNCIEQNTVMKPEHKLLTTYHYRLEEKDEFLILNEMAEQVYKGEVTVKAEGIPVRYYAWENRLEKMSCETLENGKKRFSISLNPLELGIIIFIKDVEEMKKLDEICPICEADEGGIDSKSVINITEFSVGRVDSKEYLSQLEQAGCGIYPSKAVVSVTEKETVKAPFNGMQKKYPDYSGFYIYETKVDLAAGGKYELQIEDVSETAEVFFNGKSLGMRVQRPYTYQIPAELVQSENELRIETATLLERKVKAMGAGISAMSQERPLSPTGIVGKVAIAGK